MRQQTKHEHQSSSSVGHVKLTIIDVVCVSTHHHNKVRTALQGRSHTRKADSVQKDVSAERVDQQRRWQEHAQAIVVDYLRTDQAVITVHGGQLLQGIEVSGIPDLDCPCTDKHKQASAFDQVPVCPAHHNNNNNNITTT